MLETDLEKILDGIDVTAYVLGAEEKILQLPEEEEALKEKIAPEAEKHGISVVNAFVKVREYRGHALHHIETMAAVADLMNDSYEPGVHIAVCREGKTGELKKYLSAPDWQMRRICQGQKQWKWEAICIRRVRHRSW